MVNDVDPPPGRNLSEGCSREVCMPEVVVVIRSRSSLRVVDQFEHEVIVSVDGSEPGVNRRPACP